MVQKGGWISTRKHRNLVNIVELAISLPIERSPQIRDKDLCSLQKPHFAPLELVLVSEAREALGQQVDQPGCGVLGVFDECHDAAFEFLLGQG
jgi:hypothetical protein